jgi:hypothetical protein
MILFVGLDGFVVHDAEIPSSAPAPSLSTIAHFAPLLSPLARQQLRVLGYVGSDPPGRVAGQ